MRGILLRPASAQNHTSTSFARLWICSRIRVPVCMLGLGFLNLFGVLSLSGTANLDIPTSSYVRKSFGKGVGANVNYSQLACAEVPREVWAMLHFHASDVTVNKEFSR